MTTKRHPFARLARKCLHLGSFVAITTLAAACAVDAAPSGETEGVAGEALSALDQQIVGVYQDTLERAPQQWEIDAWRGNVNTGGWTIKTMRHAFTQTAECGNKIVQVYQQTLSRTPAAWEVSAWRNNLDVNGWTIATMRAAFQADAGKVLCWLDGDGDGFTGTTSQYMTSCAKPWYPTQTDDCDDTRADVFPQDCSSDADGDHFLSGVLTHECVATSKCLKYDASKFDCDDGDPHVPQPCLVDSDRDTYPITFLLCQSSCPSVSGDTKYNRHDCDDAHAAVHPAAGEAQANGVDDDCADGVDEAQFDYQPTGRQTATSLELVFTLNEPLARAAQQSGKLYAQIAYANLQHSKAVTKTGYLATALYSSASGSVMGKVTLAGLQPSTVYRGTLLFASDANGTRFDTKEATLSEPFYGMTLAQSSDRVAYTRPVLVNQALTYWAREQHGAFKAGLGLPSCGHCDMQDQAVGGSSATEWCSEFYNACTNHWFIPMFELVGSDQVNTNSVMDAFQHYGGVWIGDDQNPAANLRAGFVSPGDYLAKGENGTASHSQMYLAYDADTDQVWYVAGNESNEINVASFTPDNAKNLVGVGLLTTAMLKN